MKKFEQQRISEVLSCPELGCHKTQLQSIIRL